MVPPPRALSGRTVLVTLALLALFVGTILWVTGSFSDDHRIRRMPSAAPDPGEGRTWFVLSVALLEAGIPDAPESPFQLALEPGGRAFIINGREELTAEAALTNTSLTLVAAELGSRLTATVAPNGRVTGTLQTFAADGRPLSLPVEGARVPDGLPVRRFPRAPDRDEARVEGADFSHVWALELGEDRRVARAVFAISDTGEAFGTVRTAEGDFGALAGRQFGRVLVLSTFDGLAVRAMVATLTPAGDAITGMIATAGERPTELRGRRADRVDLPGLAPAAAPEVDVPTNGPRLDVYVVEHHRPCAEALALIARIASDTGIATHRVTVARDAPERRELVALPTFVVRGPGGQVTRIIAGLPSRFAGGSEVAAELEKAVHDALARP